MLVGEVSARWGTGGGDGERGNTVSQGGPLFSRRFSKPWREDIGIMGRAVGGNCGRYLEEEEEVARERCLLAVQLARLRLRTR